MENIEKTSFKLFSKTGEVGYYMLYRALKENNKDGTN